MMILYGFGIAFTTGVTGHLAGRPAAGDPDDEQLRTFWRTVPRSMFTLFKSIAGGISWHEVVVPLSDLGWAYVALFVCYITFIVFAVLNAVTAVFCQRAIESAQTDKELATMDLLVN